ncbi:3-phosphoshikimate 1-carboxyvinyltransferase [Clostridia bacterium]|nr:3-phosphoshikimate 1-carboxyvinyltransferase [Clostridia bacterium]
MRNKEKKIEKFPKGIITPPPSKSISHRAVICAALAGSGTSEKNTMRQGLLRSAPRAVSSGEFGAGKCPASAFSFDSESVIRNLSLSDDVEATLGGVEILGAEWFIEDKNLFVRAGKRQQNNIINCKESGSTLRFLIPVAALSEEETVFKGKGRLLIRPMDVYDLAFEGTPVKFYHTKRELRVRGPLRGGAYFVPGDVSSQFISGLLFALPLTRENSEIHLSTSLESRQYVNLTLDVMRSFGVEVEESEYAFYIKGRQAYRPCVYTVETDFSQAAFFLGAAALGLDVKCAGLNNRSRQGDMVILKILEKMGAIVSWDRGVVSVHAEKLHGIIMDARENPDLVPPVAVLCSLCEGESRIINAGRLRLKESDRLRALTEELTKLGGQIKETADSLLIKGVPMLKGGRVDAHNDHRIAMSMALAAIRSSDPVILSGWSSVSKSYPDFWNDFEQS